MMLGCLFGLVNFPRFLHGMVEGSEQAGTSFTRFQKLVCLQAAEAGPEVFFFVCF